MRELIRNVLREEFQNNLDTTNFQSHFPKLKELKPYGLKYSVKGLKNLLVTRQKPDGTYGDNKWNRDEMPFPPELDMLNAIMQSRIAKFYFTNYAKNKGKYHYNWGELITKEALDNFPIPQGVFDSVVEILTAEKNPS
jgi:hypothetical protein